MELHLMGLMPLALLLNKRMLIEIELHLIKKKKYRFERSNKPSIWYSVPGFSIFMNIDIIARVPTDQMLN